MGHSRVAVGTVFPLVLFEASDKNLYAAAVSRGTRRGFFRVVGTAEWASLALKPLAIGFG